MSNQSSYDQGRTDAYKGLGPKAPNSFESDTERKAYDAGYNSQNG